MSGIMSMLLGAVSSVAVAVDEFFNRVTLLLPGNGTNGAQNNTFLDSSTNNFTITRNGNTTQGTFTPFSQTGWSNYFDGTDDYLAVADSAVLRPGTSNFTLEAWIWRNASGAAHTIYAKGGASTGIVFQVTSTNVLRFTHTTTNIDSTGTISANSWTHVAVVREGTGTNQTKLYINGTQDGQGTVSTDFTQTEEVRIGTNRGATDDFNGYISNLRFVKGTALYTGTFTPSASPLTTTSQGATATEVELLTCQSNRFVDNSDNAFALTVTGTPSVQAFSPFAPTAAYSAGAVGGSGYFDGSGDSLVVGNNTNLDVTTGDFTVECWFYTTSYGAIRPLANRFNGNAASRSDLQYAIALSSSGNLTLSPYQGVSNFDITFTSVPLNQWNHCALVRTGNTVYGFLNGVRNATSQTVTGALNTGTWSTYIGTYVEGGVTSTYLGYIGGFRVTKGGALYINATYTVPTAPFTTTVSAGTAQLLTNFTNAGITDATAKNVLETVGNAQISTTQSKFGGSSMYFDGTGDWLLSTPSVNNDFGTGNFTIEAWIYMTSTSNYFYIYNSSNATFNSPNFTFLYDTSLGLRMFAHAGTHTVNQGSTSGWSANTWYYVALVRNGSTITIYRDGVSLASGNTFSGVSFGSSTANLQIGGSSPDSRSNNGYIDDLRVTKGVARTITTPTAAFALQ